jgi:hypothetical protein
MCKIFLTPVAADKAGAVVADSKFCDQYQQFLTVAEYLFAENEYVGKLLSDSFCIFF